MRITTYGQKPGTWDWYFLFLISAKTRNATNLSLRSLRQSMPVHPGVGSGAMILTVCSKHSKLTLGPKYWSEVWKRSFQTERKKKPKSST